MSRETPIERFDYIVVGAGSSGSIVASRLSKELGATVLLLERGEPAEANPETLRSDGYKDAFANDRVMLDRFSVPQKNAASQRILLSSGVGMGGSGSVNGMVYTRGAREDYEEWPRGFRYDEIEPEFEAIEEKLRPNKRPPTRFTEAFIEASERAGFRRVDDLNNGDLSGVIGYEWMNYEGAKRRSSYVAFIKEERLPSLTMRAGALVRRLLFRGERDGLPRAAGAEYQLNGELRRAYAEREIILAAGALETPKLLLLSGVGPNEKLDAHGIPLVAENKAIGEALLDHPNVPLFFAAKREVDCDYPQLYGFHRANPDSALPQGQSDTCYVLYPFRSSFAELATRMVPAKLLPESLYESRLRDLLKGGVRGAFKTSLMQQVSSRLYGIIVILGKPRSRGTLSLRSLDPAEQALIDPRYLSHPEDQETALRGLAKARAIAAELAGEGNFEIAPGSYLKSERALLGYIERNLITTYHYAGTVRLGEDERSGCDLSLRLRGVSGVRIADASAIPSTPVSALNAPSMLIGYRAASELIHDTR